VFVIWKKFSVRKFMNKAVILILSIAFILILTPDAAAQNGGSRIDLQIVTDEAEAVLQILEKNENAQEITVADWQKLFATEGYARLKKRELSLRRSFEDADFKAFVLSKELAAPPRVSRDACRVEANERQSRGRTRARLPAFPSDHQGENLSRHQAARQQFCFRSARKSGDFSLPRPEGNA
jgi:hypothetical protein